MTCAAINCHNKSRRDKDRSFFNIPNDPVVKQAWIAAISRTVLPKKIVLCSDHFEEKCFDPSWKLQNELCYGNRRKLMKLIPGSIPTIFPHKKTPKERETSKARAEKKKSSEVITFMSVVATLLFRDNEIIHLA